MSEFCEIGIDEFISGKKVNLDLYIKLGAGKHVKIAHKGEDLPPERLESYRQANVQYLYVSRADYEKFVAFQLSLAKAMTKTNIIPEEKRRLFIQQANETVLHQIFLDGVNPTSFQHASNITAMNISIVSQHQGLFNLLDQLNSHADFLMAHSLGVSLYATMLARVVEWNSPATLYKVSLGGLLHDVGLKEVPREILEKPFLNHTAEEQKIYRRHPLAGMEMLKSAGDIPSEIPLIVAHHHEYRNGTGYPSGLKDAAIYPLAKIICIANEFCELTIKAPGVKPKSLTEALQFLHAFKKPFLDLKMLEAFTKLFPDAAENLKTA